ncbi:hypothetical protein GCM10027160_22420 [Streptomyces calidiresistens]
MPGTQFVQRRHGVRDRLVPVVGGAGVDQDRSGTGGFGGHAVMLGRVGRAAPGRFPRAGAPRAGHDPPDAGYGARDRMGGRNDATEAG